MKVCHMTSAHDPEDVRIFLKECVSLADEGYDVWLIQIGESYLKKGVNIAGIGKPSSSRVKRMIIDARKVYKKAIEINADIYHFHDPELIPFGLKLRKKGKTVVFDSHENTADAILEKPYLPKAIRKIVRTTYIAMEKKACKSFNAVVTVTPTQTDYYKHICNNVVEVRNSPILPDVLVEPSYSSNTIVFAGGITKQWNHHVILKALEDIPDCHYILIGPDNEYRKSLENFQAWEQVIYKGRKNHREVMELLSESMIGVALLSPGRNTAGNIGTLGNTKIFEEMIAGLPIICTNFDLWKQFVDEYECGICVNPKDVQAVKNAITRLISSPDLCAKMGKNGQKAVKEMFNWDIEKEKLLDLYRKIQ